MLTQKHLLRLTFSPATPAATLNPQRIEAEEAGGVVLVVGFGGVGFHCGDRWVIQAHRGFAAAAQDAAFARFTRRFQFSPSKEQ